MSLTEVEKLAIQKMVDDGESISTIKEVLGKTPRSKLVEKYVKTLDKSNEPKYDYQAVVEKMAKAGIYGEDAVRLIKKAVANLDGTPSVGEVYNEAIRNVGPREFMIRDSDNGVQKGNMVIMTKAASDASAIAASRLNDEKNEKYSRSVRGSVFNPQTGETE